MKTNEIIDLIQYNNPQFGDDDFGTISYPDGGTVIARGIPAAIGSLREEQKLLMNQDIQWEDRYRVLHKIFELKDLRVDAIRFHSNGKVYNVYSGGTTGVNQTVSYLVEYRDVRREEVNEPVWDEEYL